jgi:hypothetical protein
MYSLTSFIEGKVSRDTNDQWLCIVVGRNGDKSFAINRHGGYGRKEILRNLRESLLFGVITAYLDKTNLGYSH